MAKLPASFASDGFKTAPELFKGRRRVLISSAGLPNTGKTTFALTAPGPLLGVQLDDGLEGKTMSQVPIPSNAAFKLISKGDKEKYLDLWNRFKQEGVYTALDNEDCRTVLIDGDSDSWEVQRMAEFGQLQSVPPFKYTAVNNARRQYLRRIARSNKIVIATSKIKPEYVDLLDANGNPVMGGDGKPMQERSGRFEKQGFKDNGHTFQIGLVHLFRVNPEVGAQWGIRIEDCKPNMDMVGYELWGDECNFAGLVEVVFPQIPLSEWGL